jgi:hypothetical protein
MDSDEDDEEPGARDDMDDVDVKDENGNPLILTEEDRQRQEEMAEGVRHIKVRFCLPSAFFLFPAMLTSNSSSVNTRASSTTPLLANLLMLELQRHTSPTI